MRLLPLFLALLLCGATVGCGNKTETPPDDTPPAADATPPAAASPTPDTPAASGGPPAVAGENNAAPAPGTGSGAMDVSYVTADFYGALVLNMNKGLENKSLAEVASNPALDSMTEETGVKLSDLRQVVALMGMPIGDMPVQPGIILRFNRPDVAQIMKQKFAESQPVEETEFSGHTYLRPEQATEPSLYVAPNGTTAIIATEATLQKMILLEGEADTALVQQLKKFEGTPEAFGAIVMEPVRGMIKQAMESPGFQVPPPLAAYLPLVDHLKAARLKLDLTGDRLMELEMEGVGPDSVAKLKEAADANIALAKLTFNGMRQQLGQNAPPETTEMLARASQILDSWKAETEGDTVTAYFTAPEGVVDQLIAAVGPALQSAQRAAGDARVSNNAKQIALAQFNHHDTFNGFATDTISEDGSRKLSWRVHLLPFIEEAALYDQFKMDEPWDSPHNLALAAQMPIVYQTPGDDANNIEGLTRFQAFRGNGAFISPQDGPPRTEGDKTLGIRIREIVDGTSNTIMFVQTPAEKAVPWTKPADIEFNPEAPLENLGEISQDGLLVAFCDGSVRSIRDVTADLIKKLVTISGGEIVDQDF